MHRFVPRGAIAALLLLPLAAMAARPTRPLAPRELAITATDFAFRAPDTVAAGLTRIRLRNDGAEMHLLQLVRLPAGKTIDDVRDRIAMKYYLPSWTVPVGGPGVPPPGGTSEVTADLAPGRYALICFIASPDKVSHAMKGMLRELVVTPATGAARAEPHANARVALHDYTFELSAPLHAGRQVIRVENVADQPHEVGLVRLTPGKTFADALEWENTHAGPPPFTPAGGVLALAKGQVNYITADFEKGTYMLFCFVPDAKDGKPHTMHGMTREVTID
jgi:hypothetical protein